jgi:mono/diheme cytochrome c family protein
MNEKEKQEYLESYKKAKKKGVPFFPDVLYKDAIVALLVFIILVALAYFVGAPLEERANPADTSYTPRPEWYFLFLFQLLKYFPGSLEVVGVVVIPTLVIIALALLPFWEGSPKRHFLNRPLITGLTVLGVAGIVFLTLQSVREAPPPAEATGGDPISALYVENCAGCHGPNINVPAGSNLHNIIAQGKHEGMPAWNADLTTDEIDALAGFILSPAGSILFTQNCGECHEASDLVASDPLRLRAALENGPEFDAHQDVNVPVWTDTLTDPERSSLLNFLVAPDGQRLFTVNCSSCHGRSVAFSGSQEDLRTIISQGGLHLEMPPWRGSLSQDQIDLLARYVVDPAGVPDGQALFQQNCSDCHGQRIPPGTDVDQVRQAIETGGAHETMPVWGNILTSAQLDALVQYTYDAASGAPLEVGQELFARNCSGCHGPFGEGGPNPTRPNDIIAPISTAEYLKTRDNLTLRNIITQGQPNFGMSPFGTSAGGPLSDEEIDALVAYMRSWEANPPVELPPEIQVETVSLDGAKIYSEVCAQCHGEQGNGGVGPSLSSPDFQAKFTDGEMFDSISEGHEATAMIAWGELLTSDQIEQLVKFIRTLETQPQETPAETAAVEEPVTPSFSADILPLLDTECSMCHGASGGWDASTYDSVINSGNNAPVVVPGDVDASLLAHKILGTQEEGNIMPPSGKMPDDQVQLILDWIAAGAPDN